MDGTLGDGCLFGYIYKSYRKTIDRKALAVHPSTRLRCVKGLPSAMSPRGPPKEVLALLNHYWEKRINNKGVGVVATPHGVLPRDSH